MDISAYHHMNIRMSTRGKRPLRNLTPSDKVRAIQRIHNGETKASVSRDIGVPESTLRGWCKNEQKLRFMCRQLGSDQMSSISVALENPPEKRLKIDTAASSVPLKFPSVNNLDELGYNRLPLSAMDFSANNAILEKMALNELMKKNSLPATGVANKHPLNGNNLQPKFYQSSLARADYSQLAMLQNFNLLSLLHPNLNPIMPSISSNPNVAIENSKPKATTILPCGVDDLRSDKSTSPAALSVKNWAKEATNANNFVVAAAAAADTSKPLQNFNKRDLNDSNNNDVKSKLPLATGLFPESGIGMFPSLFPVGLPPIPSATEDSESSNAALMDWCKVFNASLNFLALAAAAAALQQPNAANSASSSSDDLLGKGGTTSSTRSQENILYKHLTKTAHSLASPGSQMLNSDISNDSYFDSEPEDLSVRSINSKISSPANSRSQSPTTLMSSFSAHSDAE